MPISGEYLGWNLQIEDFDRENLDYFRYCARHEFHLQRCRDCDLFVYPPRTACMWCAGSVLEWAPIAGAGAVYSYSEVHHAIQPSLRSSTPYLILMVELDTQRGRPGPEDGLRVVTNLVTPEAALAPPSLVTRVGIGSRMRMVFRDIGADFSLPMWTLDERAEQPASPWRYPGD